jgi:hypothetical protein
MPLLPIPRAVTYIYNWLYLSISLSLRCQPLSPAMRLEVTAGAVERRVQFG